MRAASASSAVSSDCAADPLHIAPGGGGGTGMPSASRTTGPPGLVASLINVSSCIALLSLQMLVFPFGGRCGAVARNAAKHGPDRHAHTGGVALAQNVAGHHFAGHEQVVAGHAAKMNDRMFIHLETQIGEGDAGPQRVGEEGRRI